MSDKFDVIIVGAGPAGTACAYTLSKSGINVVLFERGEFPGSKNIFGGILYTTILNKLIPNFHEEAPVERHITKRRFALLSEESELAMEFRSERFNEAPLFNNSYSALRAKFDRWFAQKAEEAGALIIPETVVDELIIENGKVVGVRARREGGDVYADVVVAADGANSFLAKQAGLRKDYNHRSMAVAAKEVISIPKEIIEERFCLEGNEGVAMEFFGGAVDGMVGSAFIYTNKESISVGLGCTVEAFIEKKININDLLEKFKKHPSIRRYIKGGETIEYSAHMIPEGGYNQLSKLVGDGILVVGDAAGFVNSSFYHEGTNLAMGSGMLAAEAIIEAKNKNDFSQNGLGSYTNKLSKSFVLKDLKKYKELPDFAAANPKLFKDYPDLLIDLMKEYFTISLKPKEEVQSDMYKKFKESESILRTIYDMYRFKNVMFGNG